MIFWECADRYFNKYSNSSSINFLFKKISFSITCLNSFLSLLLFLHFNKHFFRFSFSCKFKAVNSLLGLYLTKSFFNNFFLLICSIISSLNILNNVSYFLLLAKTSISYPSALTYIFIGIRINFTKTFSIPSILNNSSGSLFVLSLNKFISSRNTLLTLSIFSLNISILFTVISASNFLSLLYTTLSIN